MIIISENKRVVCDSCRQAVHDFGAFDMGRRELDWLAVHSGDEISDHLCGGREGDLLYTETCICRCNREGR